MNFTTIVKGTLGGAYTGKGKRTGTPGHYNYSYPDAHGGQPFYRPPEERLVERHPLPAHTDQSETAQKARRNADDARELDSARDAVTRSNDRLAGTAFVANHLDKPTLGDKRALHRAYADHLGKLQRLRTAESNHPDHWNDRSDGENPEYVAVAEAAYQHDKLTRQLQDEVLTEQRKPENRPTWAQQINPNAPDPEKDRKAQGDERLKRTGAVFDAWKQALDTHKRDPAAQRAHDALFEHYSAMADHHNAGGTITDRHVTAFQAKANELRDAVTGGAKPHEKAAHPLLAHPDHKTALNILINHYASDGSVGMTSFGREESAARSLKPLAEEGYVEHAPGDTPGEIKARLTQKGVKALHEEGPNSRLAQAVRDHALYAARSHAQDVASARATGRPAPPDPPKTVAEARKRLNTAQVAANAAATALQRHREKNAWTDEDGRKKLEAAHREAQKTLAREAVHHDHLTDKTRAKILAEPPAAKQEPPAAKPEPPAAKPATPSETPPAQSRPGTFGDLFEAPKPKTGGATDLFGAPVRAPAPEPPAKPSRGGGASPAAQAAARQAKTAQTDLFAKPKPEPKPVTVSDELPFGHRGMSTEAWNAEVAKRQPSLFGGGGGAASSARQLQATSAEHVKDLVHGKMGLREADPRTRKSGYAVTTASDKLVTVAYHDHAGEHAKHGRTKEEHEATRAAELKDRLERQGYHTASMGKGAPRFQVGRYAPEKSAPAAADTPKKPPAPQQGFMFALTHAPVSDPLRKVFIAGAMTAAAHAAQPYHGAGVREGGPGAYHYRYPNKPRGAKGFFAALLDKLRGNAQPAHRPLFDNPNLARR